MAARDQRTEGRRRLLTISDGVRLTPGLVAILDTISTVTTNALESRLEEEEVDYARVRRRVTNYDRDRLTPVLIQRADGLAVYVDERGEVF